MVITTKYYNQSTKSIDRRKHDIPFSVYETSGFLNEKKRNFEMGFNYSNDLLYLCQCMHLKINMIMIIFYHYNTDYCQLCMNHSLNLDIQTEQSN